MEFDGAAVQRLLATAVERLDGSWLLVGGALVTAWLEGERRTQDVDLIGPEGTREERLALLDLADELGLPIEALNTAADYFVRRVDGWESETRLLLEGSRGRILRPTVTLFLLTKLSRLSESDLGDCLAALRWWREDGQQGQQGQDAQHGHDREQGEELDVPRVATALDALPPSEDVDLVARRSALRRALPGA